MIVTCQSCDTSFQLDESRVPESGIRVRCSRCKESFFLPHPSASQADVADEIAQQTAIQEGSGTPNITRDLAEEAAPSTHSAHGSEFDQEEDWEFNQNLPSGETPAEPSSEFAANDAGVDSDSDSDPDAEPNGDDAFEHGSLRLDEGDGGALDLDLEGQSADLEADTGPLAPEDSAFGSMDDYSSLVEDEEVVDYGEEPAGEFDSSFGLEQNDPGPPLADPGSPIAASGSPEEAGESEEWDFFSDESLETLSVADTAQPTGSSSGAVGTESAQPLPQSAGSTLWGASTGRGSGEAGESSLRAITTAGLDRLKQAGVAVGWVCTLVLLAVGLSQGLLSSYRSIHSDPSVVNLGSLSALRVEGRWLDTARLGRVFQVAGELQNRGDRAVVTGAPVQVALLDASGARLDASPLAVELALDAERLREISPAAFEATRARSAASFSRAAIAPGTRVPFSATFTEIPAEATRFLIELGSEVEGEKNRAAASQASRPSSPLAQPATPLAEAGKREAAQPSVVEASVRATPSAAADAPVDPGSAESAAP